MNAADTPDTNRRLTFQEQMQLTSLSDITREGVVVKRYMSRRAAWYPGCDLPKFVEAGRPVPYRSGAAYGGHVYSQAGLAASMALRDSQDTSPGASPYKQPCIHTIHGYFSEVGATDRPFIYEVLPLAANASFPSYLVTARQPQVPSPGGDHYSAPSSSSSSSAPPPPPPAAPSLRPICFSALVSFRPPGPQQLDAQEPSAQRRFADVLASRRPGAWDPAPLVDLDAVLAAVPAARPHAGSFPLVDMRKVDLSAANAGRPLHERRELLLYRLLARLEAGAAGSGAQDDGVHGGRREGDDNNDGWAFGGPDAHILTHAFEADRNGLLMLANHAGFGFDFGRAASLSYSFVVHVNPEDALMRYHCSGESGGDGLDGWWIQEVCFPRVEAGRGIVMSKIWSPTGVHVATGYQDGIVQRSRGAGSGSEGKQKL